MKKSKLFIAGFAFALAIFTCQAQVTFPTITLATITTDSITNITATTADGFSTLTNNGNDHNTIIGLCYSTSPNPTINDNIVRDSIGFNNSVNGYIYNLNPNTIYYVRAYATDSAGTSYGNQLTFTTSQLSLPVITTDSITNITATTADGNATLTNNGNDPNTTVGVCYNTSPNPSIANNIIQGYVYNVHIINLTPNTTYYVKAYATNAAGTAYGNQLTFTTSQLSLAVITTDSITNITATTADGFLTLTNNGNDPNTTTGLCYSINQNPTINDNIVRDSIGFNNSVNGYIYNLNPNTIYYVRAYATDSAGTSYGNQLTFTTSQLSLPVITTDSITNITATTADGNATLTNKGNDPNTIVGLCYSTSPNPSIANSVTQGYVYDTGVFSVHTINLTSNTIYYIRAYATNAAGTAYGNQLTFTTSQLSLAVITTDSITNITATTADGYATLTNNGNDPNTTIGLCYSINPNPTVVNDTGIVRDSNIVNSFYNLQSNTTYYVRASATNAAGTSYGNQLTFTTGNCFASYSTSYNATNNTFTLTVDSLSVNIATAYHWDFGDGNSSMLATPTHAYTKDSVYNICLKIFTASNDSCSYCHIIGIDAAGNIYRTSGFNVIVINKNLQTGVKSIESNENSFTVFPNPTNGLINIQSSNPKGSIIQIKITDVLGNNIYSSTLQGGGQIDLSSQANGVYFISIQTNEGTVNKKIIITQ